MRRVASPVSPVKNLLIMDDRVTDQESRSSDEEQLRFDEIEQDVSRAFSDHRVVLVEAGERHTQRSIIMQISATDHCNVFRYTKTGFEDGIHGSNGQGIVVRKNAFGRAASASPLRLTLCCLCRRSILPPQDHLSNAVRGAVMPAYNLRICGYLCCYLNRGCASARGIPSRSGSLS